MKHPTWLKLPLSCLLVALAMIGLIVPVMAEINDGLTPYNISSLGAGSPDIEVSSDGVFIAVAYYKQEAGEGPVYVKSATSGNGWVTSQLVGIGSDPQLAFKSGVNNVVYVVWRKSGGRAIQSAKCTLNATGAPQCTPGADVKTTGSDQLNFPDVVVEGSGFIQVVWQNSIGPLNTTAIETARSTAANSVSAWSVPVTVASSLVNRKPVLAFGNSFLHLAFLNGTDINSGLLTSIQYHRSTNGSSWSNLKSFAIAGGANDISTGHETLDNPTIAVSSSKIHLAWDGRQDNSSDYSLFQATSISADGSTWPASANYAPSGSVASSNPSSEIKSSTTLSLPPQQVGLRPSLALNGSTPVIAWQEIPGQLGCAGNTPFFYIFRVSPLTGIANYSNEFLANQDNDDEMVDVDLAIGSSGTHQVYMLDANVINCPPPNGADGYLITYRGPFDKHTLDLGEGGNNVFVPIVRK
jgi:hypothetical protein